MYPASYGASSLSLHGRGSPHSFVMIIETVEASSHGANRNLSDVVVTGVIGVVLFVFVPAKQRDLLSYREHGK